MGQEVCAVMMLGLGPDMWREGKVVREEKGGVWAAERKAVRGVVFEVRTSGRRRQQGVQTWGAGLVTKSWHMCIRWGDIS
jgi:hypothetical protein